MENCGNLAGPEFALHSRAVTRVAALGAGRRRGEAAELHACSACAGDYEDPDRTARQPEGDEEHDEDVRELTPGRSEEEFPAE